MARYLFTLKEGNARKVKVKGNLWSGNRIVNDFDKFREPYTLSRANSNVEFYPQGRFIRSKGH